MAQRYTGTVARERMSEDNCPECGDLPAAHSSDNRFWIPRACDLTLEGVKDRIAQYWSDLAEIN